MRFLIAFLAVLICSESKVYADAPVIWFGQWAKSLTNLGLEAKGLKLDKDNTGTPAVTVIPSSSLATSWQMTLPVDDGAANDVLISDGSGVTSWANATGLITGSANTFAGYSNTGFLGSVTGWSWIDTTGGANVQIPITPDTGEGYKNVHTFGSSLNPVATVTGSSWIHNQTEINVGSNDSGFSFSADGSGQVIGIQNNVNSRNKSDVGQVIGYQQNTQIGNGVDPVTSYSYAGYTTNYSLSDNSTADNQNYMIQTNAAIGTGATVDTLAFAQGNVNSSGTIQSLIGLNLGGNANNVTNFFNGYALNYNFNDVQDYLGFSNNANIVGSVANTYKGFSATGNIATTNGVTIYSDYTNVTNNALNSYQSMQLAPNVATTTSYFGIGINPNLGTVSNGVFTVDLGGTASTSTNTWTDINIHPNLPLVTDGYRGLQVTPTATGDGSGYAASGYFDSSNLTNFSAGQVKAIQAVGDVNVDGKLAAVTGLTVQDNGFNPASVHTLISQLTTPANTTTANIDTISTNTAALMNISTNSINTSGPLGLGLAALALPAVLKTESGSSIDHVNASLFAVSMDGTSTGGTVDELVAGRFTVIPGGGSTTVNGLKLIKADLPFGDPATRSWGFYGSSTTSENWFAKNIKIGGTAGITDYVSDSGSALEVEGGSINVLNGQLKTTTANGNIYITPNGSGCLVAQIPDSTNAGGNPRGNYCVDLQTYRANPDEVASGGVSVVIGAQNKASADFSMALGGANNAAIAQKSVTLGGADNLAQYQGSYVFGTGGTDTNAGDFIFAAASGGGGGTSEANNFFRLAGDTHDVVVGKYVTGGGGGGGGGYTNAVRFQDPSGGNEDKYIALRAPSGVTTSTTFKLPNGDGTSGQVLQTDGSGNLGWVNSATVPSAGGIYSDGSNLQTVPFTGNSNKIFAVNPLETAMAAKTLQFGTGGSDVNITNTATDIILNIPSAGVTERGLVTTTAQQFAGVKTFLDRMDIASGSVSDPSIGFQADDDGSGTGLYRTGANALGFAANGINVGGYSASGAYIFGPTGGVQNHLFNGQIQLSEQTSFASQAMIWRDTTDQMRFNSNGYVWKSDDDSTTYGSVDTDARWTVGDTANTAFKGNKIVGKKDGGTVASGYVGEVFNRTQVAAAQLCNNGMGGGVAAATTVTLTPGIWMIWGEVRSLGGAGDTLFADLYYDGSPQPPSVSGYTAATAGPRVVTGPAYLNLSANKNVTVFMNLNNAVNCDAWLTAVRMF